MKLLPVRNYRWTNHRCCARCRYWDFIEDEPHPDYTKTGHFKCRRLDGPQGDWNEIEPEFRVCDLFAHPIRVGSQEEKAITLLEACYCFPDYPKCEYCQLIDAMLDPDEEVTK